MNRALSVAPCVTVALLGLAGCRRAPGESSPAAGDASEEGRAADAKTPVLPPRCRPTARTFEIEPPDEVEIGDAFPSPAGIALGVVRRTSAGRLSTIGILGPGLSDFRLIDLSPTLGDAPPPRAVWRSTDLLVAEYVLRPRAPRPDGSHELALWAINPSVPSPGAHGDAGPGREPIATIPRQRGDSLEFDLAYSEGRTAVVWDETAAVPPHQGVVRVVMLNANQAEPAREISPADSDAESARVLANGAGFFVLWVARRPEHAALPEAVASESAAISPGRRGQGAEVTGEARALSWLEMVAVDTHGNPTGAVHRLTASNGHVSAYDAVVLPGDARPVLLAVARDDGEAVEGSGGALVRVRAGADFVDAPIELSTDGLGRGAPSVVEGAPPWLSWVDSHERLRLLPLDSNGLPAGRSSAEEALGEARPLLWLDREQALVAQSRAAPVVSEARGAGASGLDQTRDGVVTKAEVSVFLCPR